MAYNPIFDGPEKAPTNGKNGTNVVQTPTPPVNPSYGNQGDLGLNPPNGTTTPPTSTPVVNNTANARAQAFNANQQNMAQNGNSLAQAAGGVGSDSGANTQKPISQSENGEQQTQGNKANIQVDPSVQTRGNVFVKQPNAPTNNKWLGKNGVSYVKDENVGTENVYGTPYTPDANLRYAPPTPTRNLTYADFRDAMYGPEAEREKRANRQAKIQAVGDALRHIGNLATTIGSEKMGRAIPQQFKTSPAQQTLAEYKAERKERDAMGYQQLLQHQKQKQQEIQNELAQREAQRKADMDNWNMNFKVHQQKQKENQDEFNNKMALDKRGMEKEMQEFNIKIGNDKNDRENKKLIADIKHMNNQDAVAFGNLNMRQQEHFARVAGIGGYKGDGNNESGAKKMQSLYGVLNHKGKTDLTDEQISSIYNFANKKGWLNGTDATAFKNLVTTSQDGNMSKHAMISAITAALADDKNEGGKVYLANYLIENWDFEPTTAVGLKHYTTQKTNMARKANEKKFNVNTM